MGVGAPPRERLLDVAFGVLTVLPAFFDTPGSLLSNPTWGLSWHLAPVLLVLGFLGLRDRSWLWSALAAAMTWGLATRGAGWPVLGAYVLVAALRLRSAEPTQRRIALALVVMGVALAVKQQVAATVLPVPRSYPSGAWALLVCLASATAVVAARPGRASAVGPIVVSIVLFVRLALAALEADPARRLEAAWRINAVPVVYDGLVAGLCLPSCDREGEALARALIVAAPDRDEAALLIGWDAALDLGWRPARAEGVVIEVARALEARGRGGEALRLLARHPRDGEVDALRTLLERLQGKPVRWKGALLGPVLADGVPLDLTFTTDGWRAVEFTTNAPATVLHLDAVGENYEGSPVLWVTVDAEPTREWAVDGAQTLTLDRPLEPGPHRLGLRYTNDRADAGGDRNVIVTRIW